MEKCKCWDSSRCYLVSNLLAHEEMAETAQGTLQKSMSEYKAMAEKVEKVWKGEWINVTNYTVMGLFYGIRSKCHEQAIVGTFCNKYGAPMTD